MPSLGAFSDVRFTSKFDGSPQAAAKPNAGRAPYGMIAVQFRSCLFASGEKLKKAASPRQPLQQIAHHRLLHGRGLVGDDKLLDAERFAEVDGANAIGFDLIETKCVRDRRTGFAPHQIDRGVTGRIYG
jgi:hypothetical protein